MIEKQPWMVVGYRVGMCKRSEDSPQPVLSILQQVSFRNTRSGNGSWARSEICTYVFTYLFLLDLPSSSAVRSRAVVAVGFEFVVVAILFRYRRCLQAGRKMNVVHTYSCINQSAVKHKHTFDCPLGLISTRIYLLPALYLLLPTQVRGLFSVGWLVGCLPLRRMNRLSRRRIFSGRPHNDGVTVRSPTLK